MDCDHKQGRDGSGRADGIVDARNQRNRDGAAALTRQICRCGAARIDSQLGLEATPEEYVTKLVGIFREARRVLRDDGVLWVNLGSTYSGSGKGAWADKSSQKEAYVPDVGDIPVSTPDGYPAKCLIPIPWLFGLAMIADGWILRNDAIWHKPNAMPSSVSDRLTVDHEYLLLFTKRQRYYWDAEAIAETAAEPDRRRFDRIGGANGHTVRHSPGGMIGASVKRNKRTVWTVNTQPYPDAHFATWPEKLVEPMVLAGSREGDTVLDLFCGSGTTGAVALRHGRSFIGIDLNPDYLTLADARIRKAIAGGRQLVF